MRICIVGAGYVGLVTAACLADFGNKVFCIDKDSEKIRKLKKGNIDFFELGLSEMVLKNTKAGRLEFLSSTSLEKAVRDSNVIFIAVGTPPLPNGDADLSAVYDVAKRIGKFLKKSKTRKFKVVVVRSTVPVGTSDQVAKLIGNGKTAIISNPEFLREGHTVYDFLHPERIVIGSNNKSACNVLSELYRPLNARIIFMGRRSAELTKYASNAFLANKISFINEIACICEGMNANIKEVADGMGYDSRIGHAHLRAGVGYGGSCLPKDVTALIHLANKAGHDSLILKSIDQVNNFQRRRFLGKIIKSLKKNKGKTVCVWGLSFKPQTDDLRDAPSVYIINALVKEGYKVKAYDPMTNGRARQIFSDVEYFDDLYSAVKGSDILVVLTEWNEFREVDLGKIRSLMKHPVVFDGRNIFNHKKIRESGFKYTGIGVQ